MPRLNRTLLGIGLLVTPLLGCSSRRAVEVVAGKDNTCLRTDKGRIYCFGDDAYTQTKDPSFGGQPGKRTTPRRVGTLEGASSLSLSASHGCAGIAGGGLRCFLDVDLEPASLSGADVRSVHAFLGGVCAVTSAGELKCFRAEHRALPKDVADVPASVSGVVAAAAGERHVCVLQRDGTVGCFGDTRVAQLGPNSLAPDTKASSFLKLDALKDVTALAAGQAHTCALKKDGTVVCWGMNDLGQLGRTPPLGGGGDGALVAVAGLTDVVAIGAGYYHTCAVHRDGGVSCFGSNHQGELGRPAAKPPQVKPERVPGITSAVQVACGEWHSCAALQSGSVMCWGKNHRGQLGNGTNVDSYRPVEVKLP